LGRNVQVFAMYTQKRDVTRRIQELMRKEEIRAEVLTAETPPEQRESWYERQLQNGMQVCILSPEAGSGGARLCGI
jgi:superfamily II DNA or RNA helicase